MLMPSKVGCGPAAAFILIVLILLMIGSNEAVGYYFSRCDHDDPFSCLMESLDEPEEEEGSVVATGVYTYKDYAVTVTMKIPLGGGDVTGVMSGTCDGQVTATYNGQQNGPITGTITGACSPFFVNIPASATFIGSVNKSGKTVPLSFNGKGAGITHDGSMTLVYK